MQFDANEAKKKLSELATFPDRKQHILPHCFFRKKFKGYRCELGVRRIRMKILKQFV